MRFSKSCFKLAWPLAATLAVSSCSFKHKKYENPITAQTQQPDKILFDKAIKDLEKGRYEIARITLNTLMNTYESSEYMAKAKLAVADAWYREGGARGRAQAEAGVQGLHPVLSHHAGGGGIAGKAVHDPLPADGQARPRSQ